MAGRDPLSGLSPEIAGLLRHGTVAKSAVKAMIGETRYRRVLQSGLLVEGPGRILIHPPTTDLWTPIAEIQLRFPSAVASHRTACWAHQVVPFNTRAPSDLDFTVDGHVRIPGAHKATDLRPWDVIMMRGLRVTSAERTLADLGALVGDDIVERVGERMLYDKLVFERDLDHIVRMLKEHGRAGVAALGRFLERRGPGTPPTGSDLETRFIQVARSLGFPEPTDRQFPILRPGRKPFVVDFAYRLPRRRLVLVEIDGVESHTGRDALVNSDRRQNQILRSSGAVLLRFTSVEIDERPDFIDLELGFHVPRRPR